MVEETEVFKLNSGWNFPRNFDKTKCYAWVHYTRKEGTGPYNSKYFTTKPLNYLGKHIRNEKGFEGGYEVFSHNGKETKVGYDIFDDYHGTLCYKIVPCISEEPLPCNQYNGNQHECINNKPRCLWKFSNKKCIDNPDQRGAKIKFISKQNKKNRKLGKRSIKK